VEWLAGTTQTRGVVLVGPSTTQLIGAEDDFNLEDNKILIQFELYTGLISEFVLRSVLSVVVEKRCKKYLGAEWSGAVSRFFDQRFQGINILGCGLTLKPAERRQFLGLIKRERKLEKASTLIQQIAADAGPLLVSDDPEAMVTKGGNELDDNNIPRIGAYLSVLTHLHSFGFQVILFMKEHVLQSVSAKYADYSHFEDRIGGLNWEQRDLESLLENRISKRLKKRWNEVFDVSKDQFVEIVFPFLINGPRDLLYICNTAGKSGTLISKSDLQRVIRGLSNRKWTEIRQQFGQQWPNIAEFSKAVIEAIRESGKQKISHSQFDVIVQEAFEKPRTPLHRLRKETPWINTCIWMDTPSVDERLFAVGCLGYVFDGKEVFPWAGRHLSDFRLSSALFVSPVFARES
jgi:hypothetical protein